ncbi:MBL fold metallo-hydrolase [Acinetobacter sp. AM]|uniref:MBL fold metallo-hydrolase n=1 Tax=Acinetobacter sp. AM TaxID=2170730 RepID=UPI000DE62539|nr:MBL fold metallo-hydrolase [Acinetobacter sp. AM]PWB14253.1 MBL fold metallo-hydrolase [Acinetobacter sp. AM]
MIHNIHHLHCGTMCPVCGPLFGQKGLHAHVICHCLLLETDRGLVLIDTGLGMQDLLHTKARLGNMIARFGKIENNLELTAIAQIQKLGFNPKDVQHIFVSHLDFDHAGGISDFPQATVHVLSSEYNATQNLNHYKRKARYKVKQFQQHRYWNFIEPIANDDWFNLKQIRNFDLFENDLLMIPLLGHTAGHSGIAVRNQDQWLLFCGDAYYSHLQLDGQHKLRTLNQLEQFFAEDNQARVENLTRLQTLSQTHPEVQLICAHDPVELARYQ